MHQPQIGEGVFDLFAFIEARRTDQFVFDLAADKDLFQGAALGVGAIHDGKIAQPQLGVFAHQPLDLVADVGGLFNFVVGFVDDNTIFAQAIFGMQLFGCAIAIVINHRVGNVENGLCTAVVLLKQDDNGLWVILLKSNYVLVICPTPSVN